MGEITSNASASISLIGTLTVSGSITWTTPSLPDGVSSWDSIRISGMWTWGGSGNAQYVNINGTNTTSGTTFDIDITGKTSPLSVTSRGSSWSSFGDRFSWSNLLVTYTYTDPVSGDIVYVKNNGVWETIENVYQKKDGAWVELLDYSSVQAGRYKTNQVM